MTTVGRDTYRLAALDPNDVANTIEVQLIDHLIWQCEALGYVARDMRRSKLLAKVRQLLRWAQDGNAKDEAAAIETAESLTSALYGRAADRSLDAASRVSTDDDVGLLLGAALARRALVEHQSVQLHHLAALVGITTRRLRYLIADGVLRRVGKASAVPRGRTRDGRLQSARIQWASASKFVESREAAS